MVVSVAAARKKGERSVFIKVRTRFIVALVGSVLGIACYAFVRANNAGVFGMAYGDILSRDSGSIKNSVVEEIALYPQKMAHSRDRIMRKGILVMPKGAKATVLISHGFMCTKEDVAFLRSFFPNYNCMTFDMRAHGENIDGQYCTFGRDEALDVTAAARFLRNHPLLKDKPLIAYGFSMGAVALIEAQAKSPDLFDGMILDCPFDATENVIKKGLDSVKLSLFGYEFGVPGRSLMGKYAFHPYVQSFIKVMLKAVAQMSTRDIRVFMYPLFPSESVKKVAVPLFLIHCKNDEKISVTSVKKIYRNAASQYKKLWITGGRRHYDSIFHTPEVYGRKIRNFARKVARGELDKKKKQRIIEDIGKKYIAVNISVGRVKAGGRR